MKKDYFDRLEDQRKWRQFIYWFILVSNGLAVILNLIA